MRAVIFVNGELKHPESLRANIRTDDLLIAADGGALHALAMGLRPDIVIGDCDSLPPEDILALEKADVGFQKHPTHKDQTDLELALDYAHRQGAAEILLIGALGGRWDQTLANILLCFQPKLVNIAITIYDGTQKIFPIRRNITIQGTPGDTISLLPVDGDANGVTTSGLEYPLNNERLPFGTSLGVSNILATPIATIIVRQGQVLCIHITQTKEEEK